MSKNWFLNQQVAAKRPDLPKINETFMQGGFYRMDLSDKVSILSLNTLVFNTKTLGQN